MKTISKYIFLTILTGLWAAYSLEAASVNRLSVSADKRYLVELDGTPVFLMGEAAWTMPENCTREDVDYYLADRKSRGFNYLQIVAARDLNREPTTRNSIRTMNPPNMYSTETTKYYPFEFNANGKADISKPISTTGGTPSAPNDYWDHVEYILQKAKSLDMYVAIFPTWGKYYINIDNNVFPNMQLFTSATAKLYGYFLGNRFKNYPHIIWILGGDIEFPTQFIGEEGMAIYRALAEGIAHGMTGIDVAWNQASPVWDRVLITTHHKGAAYTYYNNDAWLKLNANYGGGPTIHAMMLDSYAHTPTRPSLLTESYYEGWVSDGSYRAPLEIRQQIYQAIFGGGLAGYAYGMAMSFQDARDQVFRFQTGWRNRLSQEGADDMRHVVNLLNNYGIEWWTFVPDQTAVVSGQGEGALVKAAVKTKNGKHLLVYFPGISSGGIDLRKITSHLRAQATWYDTRNGTTEKGGVFSVNQTVSFIPPLAWLDAVLILEGTSLPVEDPPARDVKEFKTIDGEVVLAAENFSYSGGVGGLLGTWAAEQIKTGYLGASYMQSSLDKPADKSHLDFHPEAGNLNYVIDFKEAGTYYLHLRTYAVDDSQNGFFATLDGTEINYGGVNPTDPLLVAKYIYVKKLSAWNWYTDGGGADYHGLPVSFVIASPGKHTFSLYRREAGSSVDHLWMTKHVREPQNTGNLSMPQPDTFLVNTGSPADTVVPSIVRFSATPISVRRASLAWEVTDTGGSHLDRIELWRTTDENGSPATQGWRALRNLEKILSSQNIDSHIGTAEDGVSDAMIYWYKMKVFDQQQNQVESASQRVDLSGVTPSAPMGLTVR